MEVKPAPQPMPSLAPTDEGAAVEAPQPATKPTEKPTGSSRE